MAMIHHIHDKFFKRSLKEKRIAVDFLHAHLPAHLYQLLNIDTLTLTDKSLVLPKLRELHCDIVYQCQINQQEGYVFFLIEHQSSALEMMAFRKLQYTVALMDEHLRAGHAQLPLILPICLYHGSESPYPHSTDVYDEFNNPALARELVFKPFHLIDLTTLTEEAIEKHGLAALMEMLLKHYRTKDFVGQLKHLVDSGLWAHTIHQLGQTYLTDVLHYAFYSSGDTHSPSADTLIQRLAETLPDEREAIMTLGELLEQRGEQRGQQKGRLEGQQQGEHQKALAIAKNMLAKGVELAFIEEVTELSADEITTLIQTH